MQGGPIACGLFTSQSISLGLRDEVLWNVALQIARGTAAARAGARRFGGDGDPRTG
jgi:hypothetical protein